MRAAWLVAAVLLGALGLPAAGSECMPLDTLTHVAVSEKKRLDLGDPDYYFCGSAAPAQFACSCPTTNVCYEKLADGIDVGVCGCCAGWVWAVLGSLVLMGLATVGFCVYACCCRGRWWCDGYHPPVQPYLPRRGPPVTIPASLPLPQNLFRHHRAADFASGPAPQGPTLRNRTPRTGSVTAAELQPLTAADPDPDAPPPAAEAAPSPVRERPGTGSSFGAQRREETANLENIDVDAHSPGVVPSPMDE